VIRWGVLGDYGCFRESRDEPDPKGTEESKRMFYGDYYEELAKERSY
jgi:hypothetical protein